jgi:phage terminase large subunit-like protein
MSFVGPPPADLDVRFSNERADRAQNFMEKALVHPRGPDAGQPFRLAPWEVEVVRALFGTVVFDPQFDEWVRLYRLLWLELARGNGKTALMAAIALVLLCADDEEAGEVYGAAKDREQASHVFTTAARMVQKGPLARMGVKVWEGRKRIIFPATGSFYQVIAADAGGALGQNPHGIFLDEAIAQPGRDLWDALKGGMGKRTQPLMVAGTTAGADPRSFAAEEHAFSVRVAEDPSLDPTRLVVIRNTPKEADPFDERSWLHANPGLGSPPNYRDGYLSIATLREEAREAKESPGRENAFRQFRLNQWVQQRTRFIPLHVWDAQGGDPVEDGSLAGRQCWGGLDLGAVSDLTAWVLVFADDDEHEHITIRPRFWVPEAQVEDDPSGEVARLAKAGWIEVTEGNVTDYRVVREALVEDADRFVVSSLALDYAFQGIQLAQELVDEGLVVTRFRSGFRAFAEPMVQFERRVVEGKVRHGGNPVLRWMVDNLAVVRNAVGLTAPAKDRSGGKIDGVVATVMGVGEMTAEDARGRSAYEDGGLMLA